MTEQQQITESRPESQADIRIRERLEVLKRIAYRTIVSISTMDEGSVYRVLTGRELTGKPETRTQQNAIDLIRLLNTVANKDGVQEFLEAGGVIPVISKVEAAGMRYSLILAGNLIEGGEEGKVGPTIVKYDLVKDNVNPSEISLDKLNEDWVQKFWGKMTEGDASSYAHQLVHKLSHFKPKDLLYELVKALK